MADFIREVKADLLEALDNETPFFEIGDVELEVSFALDASAKAGAKLFVVDIGGETKATQTHKVKIQLHPFVNSFAPLELPKTHRTTAGSAAPKPRTYVRAPKGQGTGAQDTRTRPVASKKLPRRPGSNKD